MKPRGIFTIVEFTNASGSISYRVTGTKVTGERVQTNFSTTAEAMAAKQRLEIEKENLPPAAGLVRTSLTPEQCEDASRALADLNGRSLTFAVRFFLENYREASTTKAAPEAFAEFIAAKTEANLRPLSIQNLRVRVGRLIAGNASKSVSDITDRHVSAAVHRPGCSPKSRDNERRALSSFFTWAKKQGYCAINPVESLEPIKHERETPEILSVAKTRSLLAHARTHGDGTLVSYFALAIFAAIRPTELSRLTWDDIDLESKTITIEGKAAKLRQRRTVAISDNLVAWLKPHAVRRTPIVGRNWRRDFDQVKEMAGFGTPGDSERKHLKPWTQDLMRHTGISYHFAQHQHEGQTASWAGNSPDMIHRHYKGLVKPKDAKEFWSIRPITVKSAIVVLPTVKSAKAA